MENNDKIDSCVEWYIEKIPIFRKLSKKIENILQEILDSENLTYHIITSRCKEVESYKKKISNEKYDNPISQITDLAGIRIITYVEDEVKEICKIIEDAFQVDKEKSLDKSQELGIDKVGYKSVHYVAKLKTDRLTLPEYKIYEENYFEIQVRTILQHAWAEIEHDRNYKFSGKLPDEIARRFKLLAGSLEMSDREFNNISRDIDKISKEVKKGAKKGDLNFEINSTSIKQYFETKFSKLINSGVEFTFEFHEKVAKELENYGIQNLRDLDEIMPKNFENVLIQNSQDYAAKINLPGLIRVILIIHDYDKYFLKAWNNTWKFWSPKRKFENIFKLYNIDWSKIYQQYGVSITKPVEPKEE